MPHGSNRKRLANWDVLRSFAMLSVLVVHLSGYLGPIAGYETQAFICELAFLCDPVFFALSGYFAIRALKSSLKDYYLRRIETVVLPCLVYGVVLYLATSRLRGLSLAGFVGYLYEMLVHEWWFVPTLIPFLIAAPFLFTLFEALSDKQVVLLTRIVAVLMAWGAASMLLTHVFDAADMPLGVTVVGLVTRILPTEIVPGSGYFIYFCLGYFIRRLALILGQSSKRRLVAIGLVAWAMDVCFYCLGFERFDPSYYWLFATAAVFLLFDGVHIRAPFAERLFSWTARRSYSIYLLQYTAIAVVAKYVYELNLFGNVASMPAPGRIGVWIAVVIGAYLISLVGASVLDVTLLKWVQNGWQAMVVGIKRRRSLSQHA